MDLLSEAATAAATTGVEGIGIRFRILGTVALALILFRDDTGHLSIGLRRTLSLHTRVVVHGRIDGLGKGTQGLGFTPQS